MVQFRLSRYPVAVFCAIRWSIPVPMDKIGEYNQPEEFARSDCQKRLYVLWRWRVCNRNLVFKLMSSDYLIGIDIGTTSVKSSLFDKSGVVVKHIRVEYPTRYPEASFVEQNPQDWMDAIHSALSSFLPLANSDNVRSIGITSQVNTHVFCDKSMHVLAPAMVWNDGRAAQQATMLDGQVDNQQRLDWWGAPMPIDASHALSRMRWMQEQHPDLWNKTKHVLLPKDYCIWQLTGELVSDPWSNIGLVDQELEYIPDLLRLVSGAAGLMPPVRKMTDIAGVVNSDLPFSGVPVAVGTMDAWAGVFGVGVHSHGECVYLSGTSEVLGIVSDTIHPTPGVLVMPRNHDITMHIGPTQSGGASQLWFCRLFGLEPQDMAQLADQHRQTGKAVPLFLPHLQGERAPIWDSAARGVFIGLESATDRNALACSVYEGVACSARWLLESLQQSSGICPGSINVGGGGFRSDVWNQIRADILGVNLSRVAVTDPGTLGAAGIGAIASGMYHSVQEAFDDMVVFDRHYEPNPSLADYAAERMDLFKNTYKSTLEVSHRWLNG